MDFTHCSRCHLSTQCPFGLSPGAAHIRTLLQWHWYSTGYVVFRQDQPVEGFYIVQSGRVKLYYEAEKKKTSLGTATPGWILGVEGLTDDSLHSYAAQTAEDTEMAFLSKKAMTQLLENEPEIAIPLLHHVANQSQELILRMLKLEGWGEAKGDG